MDRPETDALVVAVQNPKGGCGKTTMAVNLARAVQLDGFDVVILDSDTQGTARDWRARSPEDYDGPRVQPATSPRQFGRLVEEHGAGVDVVVIDGSARLGEHTGTVVAVADVVLIPVQPTAFDLWGRLSSWMPWSRPQKRATFDRPSWPLDGIPERASLRSSPVRSSRMAFRFWKAQRSV